MNGESEAPQSPPVSYAPVVIEDSELLTCIVSTVIIEYHSVNTCLFRVKNVKYTHIIHFNLDMSKMMLVSIIWSAFYTKKRSKSPPPHKKHIRGNTCPET